MVKSFLHIGISVIDLEASVKFYSEIMQMDIERRSKYQGDLISRIVGVKDADLDICVLEKDNLRIELLDYNNNKRKKLIKHPNQDQPGLVHADAEPHRHRFHQPAAGDHRGVPRFRHHQQGAGRADHPELQGCQYQAGVRHPVGFERYQLHLR